MNKHRVPAIICCSLLILGCSRSRQTETWEVMLGAIPPTVTVRDADQGVVYYLLKQTHEPLFRQEDGTRFTSRILSRWSRNISYSEFEFCPDVSLKFDSKNQFSFQYFRSYLETVTRKYPKSAVLTPHNGCVGVKFDSAQPEYLVFLTDYKNAPSVASDDGFEAGLGQFYVKSLTAERAVLLRKRPLSGAYNKIIAHAYHGPGDPNLQNRNITDFNRISSYDQPGWIKEAFVEFINPELKTVNLILNHPDKNVRRALYGCMDVDEFRQAFMPQRKDYFAISTMLPLGIHGAQSGKPRQNCGAAEKRMGVPGTDLTLLNQQWDNAAQLKRYLDVFFLKTGIRITVLQPPQQKIVEMLHAGRHSYNLAVVVTGAAYWDYTSVFQYYADKGAYFDQIPPTVRLLYNRMKLAEGDAKSVLAAKMAEELRDQYMVLALYQTTVKLYYPKSIKNLVVGRGVREIPEVADFRL